MQIEKSQIMINQTVQQSMMRRIIEVEGEGDGGNQERMDKMTEKMTRKKEKKREKKKMTVMMKVMKGRARKEIMLHQHLKEVKM